MRLGAIIHIYILGGFSSRKAQFESEKMCMPASSTNVITTGSSLLVLPRHIRNVFYFLL